MRGLAAAQMETFPEKTVGSFRYLARCRKFSTGRAAAALSHLACTASPAVIAVGLFLLLAHSIDLAHTLCLRRSRKWASALT